MVPFFKQIMLAFSLFCFAQPVIASEPQQEVVEQTENVDQIAQQPNLSWLDWISNTMTNTNSLAVRLLLVFLLGLLMSLTPCIYPMIPITAGILQSQGSKSLLTSFLLALSYTFGIATTFAILGLLAAFAGQAMGQLMSHPAFILPLIALLIYLALAMIGVYDMYIPRFLQPRQGKVQGGSFVSAFTFGAISGIVASPCLSPGLICLLCLVTTLNNWILGFILLFTFGIGLSVPLLIIGTFSSSISFLPRAGMWMVEVKKIFGYVMLAMCLYFLSYIMSAQSMFWITMAFGLCIGSIFIYYALHAYNRRWKTIYAFLGTALIAGTLFLVIKPKFGSHPESITANQWQTDYESARQESITANKLLFVDIGAPFCSICNAIDKTLFASEAVREAIDAQAVAVKVDGADSKNADLIKQYKVLGFPTILLINPESQEVIKQWGPELYGKAEQEFIDELQAIAK